MVSDTRIDDALRGPLVQHTADFVQLRGAAAAEVARVVTAAVAAGRRRDGIEPSPLLKLSLIALTRAAEHHVHAGSGTTAFRGSPDQQRFYQDEISIEEAVEMIECSPEYVRRLAREGRLGLSRKVGNRRRVSLAGVLAYLDDKASA